jgi:hypothetical protein
MPSYDFHDAHVHLTNYIQRGTDVHHFVDMMGTTIGRATLFGIPLQQPWAWGSIGDYAPTHYLQTAAPLYYYSFTDAFIATAFRSLKPAHQARLDPMITGFNPADLYAAEQIRRVLLTFPGVFSGIGELTIHKDFVSSTIAGRAAQPVNRALDRIFEFAGEAGLVVILHNDIDTPFPKPDQEPLAVMQLKELFRRHPRTTIIWAHVGIGRIVRPLQDQAQLVERALSQPELSRLYFDISWDEVAKYAVATPENAARMAEVINRYPDRFLFGTGVVAPRNLEAITAVFHLYDPLWKLLTPEASHKVRLGNYERLFDQARRDVRAWEAAQAKNARRVGSAHSPEAAIAT